MKQVVCIILLLLTFTFMLSGCEDKLCLLIEENSCMETTKWEGKDIVDNDYKVIVNGKEMNTEHHIEIDENGINLPFTVMLEMLGAEIKWDTQSKAKIKYNGESYILNTSNCTMYKSGRSFNLLSATPGGNRSYRVAQNELILDSVTIKGALQLMGTNVKIDMNKTDKIITISRV